MDKERQNETLEANIKALLQTSSAPPDGEFEAEVQRHVRAAIQRRRRVRLVIRVGLGLAAAATLIVVFGLQQRSPFVQQGTAGIVRNEYGLVNLGEGPAATPLDGEAELPFGQWLETRSGSRAMVALHDGTEFTLAPRTLLRVTRENAAIHVGLARGFIDVIAAEQPPEHPLVIESPGAATRILGTTLNLRVAQKPDGQHRTRVRVASGRVQFEAAGKNVLLAPGVEGVVEEGGAPLRRSLIPELNELVRLVAVNEELAAQAGVQAGRPRLLDVRDDGSASLWTAVPLTNTTNAPLTRFEVGNPTTLTGLRAFSLEGFKLPVTAEQNKLTIDLSAVPVEPGKSTTILVNVPRVTEFTRAAPEGLLEFDEPAGATPALTVLQFRLPPYSDVESVSPEPLEDFTAGARRCITVVAEISELGLFE